MTRPGTVSGPGTVVADVVSVGLSTVVSSELPAARSLVVVMSPIGSASGAAESSVVSDEAGAASDDGGTDADGAVGSFVVAANATTPRMITAMMVPARVRVIRLVNMLGGLGSVVDGEILGVDQVRGHELGSVESGEDGVEHAG